MKQSLNVPHAEEPPEEISAAADAAMRELVELFSDPAVMATAHFRCSTEGPTEFDVLFESILDEQFGYDENSEYKQWVRRLHRLGLIPTIPGEWATYGETGRGELVGAAGDVRLSNDLGRESRKPL
jgi:hypothetical protein